MILLEYHPLGFNIVGKSYLEVLLLGSGCTAITWPASTWLSHLHGYPHGQWPHGYHIVSIHMVVTWSARLHGWHMIIMVVTWPASTWLSHAQ